MSVAFLFPGQGAHHTGMLHQLPDHPAIISTLKDVSSALGQDVSLLDSEQALQSTVAVQLALLTAGVAAARMLEAQGARPAIVTGLSVGAFSAAVVAGILDLPTALRLVRLRGELMEHIYPHGYGMGVIFGLAEAQITRLLVSINTARTPIFLANINAPRQIVIAGIDLAIQQAFDQALRIGAHKVQRLPIHVPSHCPLMAPVAERLTQAIKRETLFSSGVLSYISSSSAHVLHTPEAIAEDLAQNVARSIRWYDATTSLFELGARLFVELPPGHVLTDLATEAFPQARSIAFANSRPDSVITLVKRER